MKTEELDYKELCKELFIITQNVFGITFMPIKVKDQRAMLEKINTITGKAYNMHAEATRKGLYK